MKRKTPEKAINRQKAIGAQVRLLRENAGLTLTEVCKRLDEPRPHKMTVARWETGVVAIGVDRLEQLAKIFGVRPKDILGYR
jgi:transcriptional regulator with XRE-family HTH domain